ncbi:hypothetical protein PVAP13_7KG399800 [Panicum virgatum]|uniref:Uncharacterized protein n=1 Tax=Panicum virgatum TaxID=38727 RepID=A0A8T0QKW1_PANVG|nr:hypothetical protein PVAP13_7KG399800 [Panicum virgatum]
MGSPLSVQHSGFRGPANPEPVVHNGTAVVAGTPRSRSPAVMPPPPPRASSPFPLPSRHTTPFVFLYACSDSQQRAIPHFPWPRCKVTTRKPSQPAVALPRRREANRPFGARSPA